MIHVDSLDTELRGRLEALRERVRKHCFSMLKNADSAEDAAQDTMLNAWNRRSTYRQDSPLEHWVMRIATNACLDIMRGQRNKPTVEFDDTQSSPPAVRDPGMHQVEDRILLQQLLPPLRECMGDQNYWIWQQKMMGATEEEISRQLPPNWKLSKDGVHSRVQRNIKACLDDIRSQHGKP